MTALSEKQLRDIRLGKVPAPTAAPVAPAKVQRTASVRTSAGLRDALFDAIDGVFSDKIAPDQAAAIAKLSGQIVATVKLEMDAHRLRHEHKEGGDFKPLMLTARDGEQEAT